MNALPQTDIRTDMRTAAAVRLRGLSMRYGSNLVLDSIDLDVHPGQVQVLFGENGAGKSTLISILAGAVRPSSGHIETEHWRGHFESVAQARAHGIRAVFQEFSLILTLTVAENIMLGEEPCARGGLLARAAAREQAHALMDRLGFMLDVDAPVADLPRGKQQMVEIAKALRTRPRVLILDEPTASLSDHDAQALFALLHQLKTQGVAIVYITHRLHEIALLGDCVTVLRDGKKTASVPADTPTARLLELMTGRSLSSALPQLDAPAKQVRLRIANLALTPQAGSTTVSGASLDVCGGEIVGIAGLVGCGKSELAQACFGLKKVVQGEIEVDGKAVRFIHPAQAIARGVWYSPSDRKNEGLALDLSAGKNMSLSALRFGALRGVWMRPEREKNHLRKVCTRLAFDAQRLDEAAANFSGGNQQKVMLAKGLVQDIAVYVFDEPTVGVDAGARMAIYHCMAQLCRMGAAILLVSSDLPELLGMTHRLLVMKQGRICAAFVRAEYDERRIVANFF